MSIELVTKLMVRRGKAGIDAILDENGQRVNPKIEVPNCLPEKIASEDKTWENVIALFGSNVENAFNFIQSYWDSYQRSIVQGAEEAAVETVYTRFYEAHPEFVAKTWAGLSGEELQKKQTTFARQISGASKQLGIDVSVLLDLALRKSQS